MKDFPVQLQTMHFVNPMAVFPMVGQALRAMLSKRLRQEVTIHTGSNAEVLESLAACSIPNACVPTSMGGKLDTSFLEEVPSNATRSNVGVGIGNQF